MSSPKYRDFGNELKRLRQDAHKTIIEVSGAFEIEPGLLDRIEQGYEKPPEEIVLQAISHFDIDESEAVKLWELAGYTRGETQVPESEAELPNVAQPNVVAIAMPYQPQVYSENRAIYTDLVNIGANNFGLTVTFKQNGRKGDKPTIVAKLGMSIDHAKSLARLLDGAVAKVEGRNQSDSDDSGPKRLV